jgi:hypothetical protein
MVQMRQFTARDEEDVLFLGQLVLEERVTPRSARGRDIEQKAVLVLYYRMGNEPAQAQRGIDLKDHSAAYRHMRRVALAPTVHVAVALLLCGPESFVGTIPE